MEIESGKLPVNTRYDPLRIVALVASKAAAEDILRHAVSLGMPETNPRLTMLNYNLAL